MGVRLVGSEMVKRARKKFLNLERIQKKKKETIFWVSMTVLTVAFFSAIITFIEIWTAINIG